MTRHQLSPHAHFKTIHTLSYGDANDAANPSPRPLRHAIFIVPTPEGEIELGIQVEELEPMIQDLKAAGKEVPQALREALDTA